MKKEELEKIAKRIREEEKKEKLKTEKEKLKLIEDFTRILKEKFKQYLKCVVVWGSQTKGYDKKLSDIDTLVIIDDTMSKVTPELATRVKAAVLKLADQVDPKRKLHIQTHFLTEFWDYVRQYDPVVIDILRYGVATYDTGFFIPLKNLLKYGRFKPTRESVEIHISRAPKALDVAKAKLTNSVYYLYLAVMNAAHAALLSVGIATYPEREYEDLNKYLVKEGKLEREYPKIFKEIFDLYKGIEHREVKEVSGEEFDKLAKKAKKFVDRIEKLIGKERKKWEKKEVEKMKMLFGKPSEIKRPEEELLIEEKERRRAHLGRL